MTKVAMIFEKEKEEAVKREREKMEQIAREERERIQAVPFHHGWIEIDTNEDYETACQWTRDGTLARFVDLL